MVYRRPKLTKVGYAQEVTGPWEDKQYDGEEVFADSADASPTGSDSTLLRSRLINYWQHLSVIQVINY